MSCTLNRFSSSSTDSFSLYGLIRSSHGINLSQPDCLPRVLRPLDAKDVIDEDQSLCNLDQEEGVLVHVDFAEVVRIKHLLMSTPPGEERPQAAKVFVNRPNGLSLEDAAELKPDQEFELLEERGCVEYATRLSRFSNVSSLTIFLMPGRRSDSLRCYYLGFKGNSRIYKKDDSKPLMQAAETGVPSPLDGLKQTQGVSQRLAR